MCPKALMNRRGELPIQIMSETRWIHPNHRKVKSCGAFDNVVGKPLTDKVIKKYQDLGWYSADQKNARRERAEKRTKEQLRRTNKSGNFHLVDGRLIYSPK
jgi:hypothetical protein